jgi:hypothetical protein
MNGQSNISQIKKKHGWGLATSEEEEAKQKENDNKLWDD